MKERRARKLYRVNDVVTWGNALSSHRVVECHHDHLLVDVTAEAASRWYVGQIKRGDLVLFKISITLPSLRVTHRSR